MTKFILAAIFAASLAFAAPIPVTIDTTSLSGENGTIDIQFNPGIFPSTYNPGTATITNFLMTAGTLGSLAFGPDGGAIGGGTLPGPFAITNSDFLNGAVYNGLFGTQLSFLVDFTGDAFTASPLLTISSFSVTLTGTASSIFANADLIGNSQLDTSLSTADVTFGKMNDVPEPSTLGILSAGAAALVFAVRRRK